MHAWICGKSIAGSKTVNAKGPNVEMCLACSSRKNGRQSAGVKQVTDDVRQKDSMNILCSLVDQDKELRDFTKWDTKSLKGFGKGGNII